MFAAQTALEQQPLGLRSEGDVFPQGGTQETAAEVSVVLLFRGSSGRRESAPGGFTLEGVPGSPTLLHTPDKQSWFSLLLLCLLLISQGMEVQPAPQE